MSHSLQFKRSGVGTWSRKGLSFFFILAATTFTSRGNSLDHSKDISSILAVKTTTSTGNWSTASVWSPSGVPVSGEDVVVNHALTLNNSLNFSSNYTFNKTVTDVTGGSFYDLNLSNSAFLDVKANATFEGSLNQSNSSSIIVRSGYTLTVGAVSISQTSSLTVEAGATLIVNGDFNASNNVPIISEGVIQINGNYSASNSVGITGNGEFFTSGVLITSNSSSAFGSTQDCNAGPCSGRNLCTYTNSITTTTPTICPGTIPAIITGTSNSTSSSILWEMSTTSNAIGFTTAPTPNSGANYSPAAIVTTTWFRKTMVDASCTTKAVQAITVIQAPAITTQPTAANICLGSNASFTVAATSLTTTTYQWQTYNGTSWSNITSAIGGYSNYITATLNITTPAILLNNYKYRCILKNSCASTTASNEALLTLNNSGYWVGGTGNWNTTSGWCGGIPLSTNDIIINSGAVTIDIANAACRNITIISPGTLNLAGINGLSVYGNWTGNNNLTQTGGTITMTGTAAQTINGNNTFKNLTVNKTSGGVTIPSGSNKQTVTGALILTSGNLTTNGNLVIDFGNGGAIAGTGTGSISGNVVTVRLVGTGWHYIGAPLDNLTYADIHNNIAMNGSNFYTYQENVRSTDITAGWVSHTEPLTTTLSSQRDAGGSSDMVGYALSFPTNTTFTLTGNYTHGKIYSSGPLAYTSSGIGSSDGWHLISNPYPSYVDWNSTLGWTKTGITGPISYYDVSKGVNVDYVPASGGQPEIALNGGSPFIPAMQAFWIQTASNNASVNINNNARIINPNVASYGSASFYRTGTNDTKSLKIQVKSSTCSDETAIRFGGSATEDFDYGIDSYKFKNDAKCPSIYSVDHQAEYAVNTLPLKAIGNRIHLNFEAGTAGTFSISLRDLKNIDPNTAIILEDTHLEKFQNLSLVPTYTFTAEAGDEAGRFIITIETINNIESIVKLSNPTVTGLNDATVSSEAASIDILVHHHDINVHFKNHESNSAEVYVYNMEGNEIYRVHHANISAGSVHFKLDHVHTGMYIVKAVSGEVSHSKKISLNQN